MTPAPSEATIVAIYRETISPLYRFISQRCGGDRAVAEDITQETWLRAVRVWRETGLPNHPLRWLITVARNVLLNQLRQRATLSLDELSAEPQFPNNDEQAEEREASTREMRVALTRLAPDEARLLEEFYFEQRRVAQLARHRGITERAVEGRLRRARERLRREMERNDHLQPE